MEYIVCEQCGNTISPRPKMEYFGSKGYGEAYPAVRCVSGLTSICNGQAEMAVKTIGMSVGHEHQWSAEG